AEFGIGHRGSTVPERSGVALSFRGRRLFWNYWSVLPREKIEFFLFQGWFSLGNTDAYCFKCNKFSPQE
ncbi:hypothetical protein KUC90_33330, partial [Pseudomonas aeruginosa]|uniref:hypothetical protein n=1 Tax=Pseudomonas aeruginosa TaxID=287 RepID=UPI0021E13754